MVRAVIADDALLRLTTILRADALSARVSATNAHSTPTTVARKRAIDYVQ